MEPLDAYRAAYDAADPDEVASLVAAAFADDGEFESAHTGGPIVGHAALTERVLWITERIAGLEVVRGSRQRVGSTVRWTWEVGDAGGVVAAGMDVAFLAADGRIARLIAFDEPDES